MNTFEKLASQAGEHLSRYLNEIRDAFPTSPPTGAPSPQDCADCAREQNQAIHQQAQGFREINLLFLRGGERDHQTLTGDIKTILARVVNEDPRHPTGNCHHHRQENQDQACAVCGRKDTLLELVARELPNGGSYHRCAGECQFTPNPHQSTIGLVSTAVQAVSEAIKYVRLDGKVPPELGNAYGLLSVVDRLVRGVSADPTICTCCPTPSDVGHTRANPRCPAHGK